MEEKPRMSSKACIPHSFQVEDWKLTGTHKNRIQTPDHDLGLPPLPSPAPSPVSLTSLSPRGFLGLLRVLGKLHDRDLQLSQLFAACLNAPPFPVP